MQRWCWVRLEIGTKRYGGVGIYLICEPSFDVLFDALGHMFIDPSRRYIWMLKDPRLYGAGFDYQDDTSLIQKQCGYRAFRCGAP
jgi:hypothetical protein